MAFLPLLDEMLETLIFEPCGAVRVLLLQLIHIHLYLKYSQYAPGFSAGEVSE